MNTKHQSGGREGGIANFGWWEKTLPLHPLSIDYCILYFEEGKLNSLLKSKLQELPKLVTKTYISKLSVVMIWCLHNGISEQFTVCLLFS